MLLITCTDTPDMVIGDAELFALKEKTNRHLRLRELLMDHSAKSNLIVMYVLYSFSIEYLSFSSCRIIFANLNVIFFILWAIGLCLYLDAEP